jgi:hypothetical protein
MTSWTLDLLREDGSAPAPIPVPEPVRPEEESGVPSVGSARRIDPENSAVEAPPLGVDERHGLYHEHLVDVVEVISFDPNWRRLLWDAPLGERIEVDPETLADILGERGRIIRDNRLRFSVFHDSDTEDGGCVLGFESVEFPEIVTHVVHSGGAYA